jgi:hypothetical protein
MVITLILLREDIAKRDDRLSWAYQYFIDNFSTQPWSRTIDFKRKNKKSKEVIKPEFIRISEKQYNSYVPWAQEVLKKRIEFHWGNEYYHYECEIPAYCLVTKIKNSYITTEKLLMGILKVSYHLSVMSYQNCTQYSLKVEVVLINGFKQNLIEEIEL